MNRRVIYSCPFVPAEWIAAHGFRPSRIIPESNAGEDVIGTRAGLCTYAHAFGNAVHTEEACAIVVTTLCDQMRRLSEAIELSESRPVFLLNVPHTWKTLNARKLYASEVQRLGRFLNELGGESPSDHKLASSMSDFDKMRSELRALRGRLKPRQFSEIIADFGIDTRIDFQSQTGTYVPRGIPLGLIGGPLLREHFRIFDLLEDCGGYVALDGTETGERAFPAPFDRRRVCEDPFPTLIDSYFDSIPDPARTPNTRLYEWLRSAIDRRNLRGIILARHLGCDNWHAEVGRMRESLRIPFFDLDITGSFADTPGKHTRLQAFMEMIR